MGHIKDCCAVSLDSFHVAMVIFATCFNNSTKTKIKKPREGYTEENTVTLSSHLLFYLPIFCHKHMNTLLSSVLYTVAV